MKKIIALVLIIAMLFTTAITINVFAADEPTVSVSNVAGKPGETVEVDISTINNPGIISLVVDVAYDADVLEFVEIKEGVFGGFLSLGPETSNPLAVNWTNPLSSNNTTDGLVATLVFKIKDTAPVGTTAITLTYDPENVCDSSWNNVYFAVEYGSVKVKPSSVDFAAAAEPIGATIRIESADSPAGLRFATTVQKADFGIEGDYKYAEDADVIFGVYMLPKKLLDKTSYNTLQALIESGEQSSAINVVAKKIYEQDETTLTYTAVLTNIPTKSWKTTVCVVPYVLMGGKCYFAEQTSNSYYTVADKARATTYSDKNIAKITDPVDRALAEEIAVELDKILDVDNQGYLDGWY